MLIETFIVCVVWHLQRHHSANHVVVVVVVVLLLLLDCADTCTTSI
jgi:hypothetical protein